MSQIMSVESIHGEVTSESSSVNMTPSAELMITSDLTDISHVEIRDGSIRFSHSNPTTTSLLRCKKQIIIPFYKLLGIIAWRPFGNVLHPGFAMMKVINVVYPVIIVVLLLSNYVTTALACRGESKQPIENSTVPEIPLGTSMPHNHSGPNYRGPSTLTASWIHFPGYVSEINLAERSPKEPLWDPAYNKCKHIFGTYILPSILHLTAYFIGFYLYRIKEHEGLYVLMEKVFLQSPKQTRLYLTLRYFLAFGVIWLLLDMGCFVLYIFAFGAGTVTGFHNNAKAQLASVFLMAAGQLVLDLVNLVIILNYAAQCQLVIHYIKAITQRIEEKSTDLNGAMKDILDVKNTLQRMNSLLSFMVSLCIFTLIECAVIGIIYEIREDFQSTEITSHRVSRILVNSMALFFPVIQAARVTTLTSRIKQLSLDVRVFGHQTSSQLELDSFLVFVQSADLKARLFLAPVQSGFLSGLVLFLVFTLLVLMQAGVIANRKLTRLF